ncbi:hypothetical protein CHU_0234 [Cytophaga hutchinsonii ATCC 33406]|uniref:Uncharacterized protein n=2 Tax=Cytophaga hutchinsonii TaxID=985 RepID=A0A6N4SMM5_CYTH3|nr:hypothetical protein CHU_0234 [Cytophaga hutchinsonii ATCC 33406]
MIYIRTTILMNVEKLPDNEMKPLNIEIAATMKRRRYGLFIAGLMLVNIILFVLFSKEEGDISHTLFIGLKILVGGSLAAGFGLGLLTALIPAREGTYSEKYFSASLLNILILQMLLVPVQIFFSVYE